MQKLIFFFVLCLVCAGCSHTVVHNSLEQEDLRGPVKSVTQKTYNTDTDSPIVYKEFDRDGYIVAKEEYNQQAELNYRTKYVWHNHLLVEESCYNGQDNSLIHTIKAIEGEDEFNRGSVTYDKDGNEQSSEWFYVDKDGNILDYRCFDENGVLEYHTISKWKNGKLQNQTTFYDCFIYRTRNVYEGNKETTFYYHDYDLDTMETYEYVYDDHGNWIKRVSYLNGEVACVDEREIIYY